MAGLGKGRLLIDKACLLTDQRWARAAVELSLEIFVCFVSRPVAAGKIRRGLQKR